MLIVLKAYDFKNYRYFNKVIKNYLVNTQRIEYLTMYDGYYGFLKNAKLTKALKNMPIWLKVIMKIGGEKHEDTRN